MKVYDLYGISLKDGDVACSIISQALKICFNPHVGDFWGEYFLAGLGEIGTYRLVQNFRDGEWEEEEYKGYPWLLEVNGLENSDEIFHLLSKISEAVFLYRSEVESKRWSRRYLYKDGNFLMTHELIL